ncbi:TetR/AcrR family transcriptional regulator [Alphaproteobacteria bacterium]|nr:TetR/AcrR family transcriptional regulator [Alphaproteobacteria bacterium]
MVRITDAGEKLFSERGYDGASVSDIVNRAQCSVGAFYARFKDKESLFLHIHDRQCDLLIQRIDFLCDLFRSENATLETMVRQSVRTLFLFAGQRRSLTRVFIQRSGIDPAFHARYAWIWGEVRTRLQPPMLLRRGEISHPDPKRAIDFCLQLMHSGWSNDVLHYQMKDITGQETGEPLTEDLTEACLAYLGLTSSKGGH